MDIDFNYSRGSTVSGTGQVYVADQRNDRILRFFDSKVFNTFSFRLLDGTGITTFDLEPSAMGAYLQALGTTTPPVTVAPSDFNDDGIVDVADLGILGANWTASQATGNAIAFVPGPTMLSLLTMSVLIVGRRRRSGGCGRREVWILWEGGDIFAPTRLSGVAGQSPHGNCRLRQSSHIGPCHDSQTDGGTDVGCVHRVAQRHLLPVFRNTQTPPEHVDCLFG